MNELKQLQKSVASLESLVQESENRQSISQSELEYHTYLVERLEEVQTAIQSWMSFLAQKYQLDEGDTISPEGIIMRQMNKDGFDEEAGDSCRIGL